jgi:hypothetical protein
MSRDDIAEQSAPLVERDEDEDGEDRDDPNRLSSMDCVWLVLHAGFAAFDLLALRALLQRRFKGALFFGGHTQFLGNWSLCLSLGGSPPVSFRSFPHAHASCATVLELFSEQANRDDVLDWQTRS